MNLKFEMNCLKIEAVFTALISLGAMGAESSFDRP